MPEQLKIKYCKIAQEEERVYQMITLWNNFILKYPLASIKEKLTWIEFLKEKESAVYKSCMEDIKNGIL